MYYKTLEEIKNAIKVRAMGLLLFNAYTVTLTRVGFRFFLKQVDKTNKALKGADTALLYYRQNFEKVRALYGPKKGTWLALDIEAWEMMNTEVTEIGWSSFVWGDPEKGQPDVEDNGHIIVKENLSLTNHVYMPEARGMRDVRMIIGKRIR